MQNVTQGIISGRRQKRNNSNSSNFPIRLQGMLKVWAVCDLPLGAQHLFVVIGT